MSTVDLVETKQQPCNQSASDITHTHMARHRFTIIERRVETWEQGEEQEREEKGRAGGGVLHYATGGGLRVPRRVIHDEMFIFRRNVILHSRKHRREALSHLPLSRERPPRRTKCKMYTIATLSNNNKTRSKTLHKFSTPVNKYRYVPVSVCLFFLSVYNKLTSARKTSVKQNKDKRNTASKPNPFSRKYWQIQCTPSPETRLTKKSYIK